MILHSIKGKKCLQPNIGTDLIIIYYNLLFLSSFIPIREICIDQLMIQ